MLIQDPNLQILNDKEVLVNILFQDFFPSFERTFFYFQPPRKRLLKRMWTQKYKGPHFVQYIFKSVIDSLLLQGNK